MVGFNASATGTLKGPGGGGGGGAWAVYLPQCTSRSTDTLQYRCRRCWCLTGAKLVLTGGNTPSVASLTVVVQVEYSTTGTETQNRGLGGSNPAYYLRARIQ